MEFLCLFCRCHFAGKPILQHREMSTVFSGYITPCTGGIILYCTYITLTNAELSYRIGLKKIEVTDAEPHHPGDQTLAAVMVVGMVAVVLPWVVVVVVVDLLVTLEAF